MTSQNQALLDELEAVNSIYDQSTCTITAIDANTGTTSTILALPDLPFSFLISFSSEYPDVPPDILSTQSTGASTKIGQGEAAANLLRDILGSIFIPGQVCLFDLVEETVPLLKQHFSDHNSNNEESDNPQNHNGTTEDDSETTTARSAAPSTHHMSTQLQTLHVQDLTQSKSTGSATTTASTGPPPLWILSEPLVVNRSTFVGRVVAASSLNEATASISHLLATNKKVASATHNITAWRIKQKQNGSESQQPGKHHAQHEVPEIVIQDCDDDGETAAGGRLLHLMQLMDVWNVVVVVTRWYGGVKLGPDRFRCINSVAREALVKGGYGKDDHEGKGTSGKGKGRKK